MIALWHYFKVSKGERENRIEMAVKTIRQFPDPVLRKKAKQVDIFDEQLIQLVCDLKDTMYHYDGIGLSAPQLGISMRVAVALPEPGHTDCLVLINPRLVSISRQCATEDEGCLSLNNVWCPVSRAANITWHAQDVCGQPVEGDADGWLARVIQHEVEHLDGRVISDYLPQKLKQKFRRKNLRT
ncbi:peptide deformylase, partial [Serratia sp. Se-PFBMAAmG]|nr:peptide deformylase [Serratia sp. Se-PFBMAAmG]